MHDIHIHTNLSSCAKPDAAYESYCRSAVERKLQVLGFTNHLWDHAVPGWSEWYAPQDIVHVIKLLDEIRNKPFPELKVYFGCETDYFGNGRVGWSSRLQFCNCLIFCIFQLLNNLQLKILLHNVGYLWSNFFH